MEIFRFSASIRMRHPSMDPEVITAALGIEPARAWRAGQDRVQKDGTKIGTGLYENSYWASHRKRGEDQELIEVLNSDLTLLEQKREFISEFLSTSGHITYYVSWFSSERSGGLELHWSLLKRLSDLQLNLSLDVYSAELEESAKS